MNCIFRNKLPCTYNRNTKIFIHENASENIVSEILCIVSMITWMIRLKGSHETTMNDYHVTVGVLVTSGARASADTSTTKIRVENMSMGLALAGLNGYDKYLPKLVATTVIFFRALLVLVLFIYACFRVMCWWCYSNKWMYHRQTNVWDTVSALPTSLGKGNGNMRRINVSCQWQRYNNCWYELPFLNKSDITRLFFQ